MPKRQRYDNITKIKVLKDKTKKNKKLLISII